VGNGGRGVGRGKNTSPGDEVNEEGVVVDWEEGEGVSDEEEDEEEEDEGEDDDGDGGTVHSFEEGALTTSSDLTMQQELDKDIDKDKDSLRIDISEAMPGKYLGD